MWLTTAADSLCHSITTWPWIGNKHNHTQHSSDTTVLHIFTQHSCRTLDTIPQLCLASGRQQEDIGLRSVLTDQLLPDPTAPYVRLDEPIASSPPLWLSSAFLPVPSLLATGVKRGRWHCLKTITAILPEDNKELMLYPTNDSNPFKCESKERKIITVSVWGRAGERQRLRKREHEFVGCYLS